MSSKGDDIMARPRKHAKALNIKMDKSAYNQENRFVLETRLTMTTACEKILQCFF